LNKKITQYENFFIYEESNDLIGHIIIKGSNKILLSAPHSVTQTRNGSSKIGEFRTGVIVKILTEKTNCNGIYKTKNLQDDANFDVNSPYKSDLVKFIEKNDISLVIDLHIASPKREFDIEIGTGHGKNLLDRKDIYGLINKTLKREYKKVQTDKLFSASFEHTISSSVARITGIPTVQLEINFSIIQSDEDLKKFIIFMRNLINDLEEIL
jgi:hypothetical protein